jgi:uncharacterized phosphosugar-binding protein
MLNTELVGRAGGLMGLVPLNYTFGVHNPVAPCRANRPKRVGDTEREMALTDVVLDASNLQPGDVVIVGSVSGRAVRVVDFAAKARERGVFVVALTSLAYSGSVTSKHPSGMRLFEAADLAVDNCAEPGDACVSAPGLPVKVIPTSGVGAAMVAWTLIAEVIERLIAKGRVPHVYASANLDWGPEFNEKELRAYETEGL